ncbi:hypothetical protein JCM10450v2_005109 [Rhodotorula kratochvilovae]
MADDDDAGWDLHALLNCAPARLSYSVHSTSGVYASFTPDNILTDNPNSDTSRWTAPSPDHRRKPPAAGSGPQRRRRDPEWIILKLDHIALVRRIGFGKTSKPHPCNLADFTLWGGLTPSPLAMEPLLDTTLKNDAVPERFDLPVALGGAAPLPVRYLKIDCHGAANAAYSISIWHIWLEGFLPSSGALAPSAPALEAQYAAHLARQSTHLTLAYLRRAGPSTLPAFAALSATPAAQGLEHPLLSSLHDALVAQGDFPRAEGVLERLLAEGLLAEHAPGGGKGASSARWARLAPSSPGPRGRGGHALVRVGRKLLLFGGWDGSRDLGDLWEWDLASNEGGWRCLDDGAGEGHGEGTPQARSCHQMAVDEREGWVYLLGGRRDELDSDEDDDEDHEGEGGAPSAQAGGMDLDGPPLSSVDRALDRALARLQRRAGRWKSDFWRYKAVGPGRGTWECLSEDTRKDGGPALLFDHAMAVHSSTSRLFVFGGKNQPYDPDASPSSSAGVTDDPALDAGAGAHEGRYSGMWCYDISQRRWSHLFGDPRPSSFTRAPSPASSDRLLSRAGHALALDEHAPGGPTLYVRGGQRNEQYLADEWAVRLAAAPAAGGEDEAEGQLWRQGAVLDLPPPPPPAGTRSLVDPAALPVSGTRSRAREPTIVQIRRLASPSSSSGATGEAPPAGFTQRLSLVPSASLGGGDSPASWTLLTGLTGHSALASLAAGAERDRERERAAERGEGEERCVRGVWRRGGGAGGTWERVREEEEGERPCGRYAAQKVVYDPLRAEHYLFGGCPEVPPPEGDGGEARLGDLWKLKIIDPTPEEALRRMKFLVRKQRFTELCATAPTVLALQYLQNDLSAVVDHSSPSESSSFRSCMTALLSAPGQMNIDADSALASSRPPSPTAGEAAGTYAARHALWEELGRFVPRGERQPDERLEDAGRVLRVWEMGGWGALGA